jgi:hypothetical protein
METILVDMCAFGFIECKQSGILVMPAFIFDGEEAKTSEGLFQE